jgi:ferrous iron transport protein A
MIPLLYSRSGEVVKVTKLAGGRNFIDKLASMGIYIGTELKIVKDGKNGPLIIAVGNTRIGLGQGMARRIFVKEELTATEVK